MSFDTTSSNTGPRNGACRLLQQKMQKDMLWLACRRPMLEIVLEAVVMLSLCVSQGPDILLFKRFQKQWAAINTMSYQTAASDKNTANAVAGVVEYLLQFAEAQLLQFQLRDDYQELLHLMIIFLEEFHQEEFPLRLLPACIVPDGWQKQCIR